jgi:ABC-2 type transport system permease protein
MMGSAIKAEFRKFFTTRLWWGLAIPVFGISATMSAFLGSITNPEVNKSVGLPPVPALQAATSVYTAGVGLGYLFTLCIGVLMIGSEYRHKTISVTFLAVPKRAKVMLAKVVAILGIGGLYGVLFLTAAVGFGGTILASRGLPAFPEAGQLGRTLLLVLLALGLWGLIGLGAGILIPNQVAALLIMIGLAMIVEPIVGLWFSVTSWGAQVAQFFPSHATQAMLSSAPPPGTSLLSWWGGALVLLAYAAVMAGIGSLLTIRRDVT